MFKEQKEDRGEKKNTDLTPWALTVFYGAERDNILK